MKPGLSLRVSQHLALTPQLHQRESRVALLRPMVEHANQVGAQVIVLTDPSATELPARADVILRCVNKGAGMFDSYIASMSVINHLCTSLGFALGATARKRLERIEALHEHYGDLHR